MSNVINLSKLKPEQTPQIVQFFKGQEASGVKFWKKNKAYNFNNGEEFKFKYDVFQRGRKEDHQGVRYEVISNKPQLGDGGFGVVKRIKGTLNLEQEKIFLKKAGKDGSRRAVKIQRHSFDNTLDHLQHEYKISTIAKHLHYKPPTLIKTTHLTSYSTMRKLPGRELFDIINDDYDKKNTLTVKDRVDLTMALLLALKTQVTDLGLVHRDLKPENILVQLGKPLLVNILDYSFGFVQGENDGEMKGTPDYLSPEIVLEPDAVGVRSDVYSMARCICTLWGIGFASYDEKNNHIYLSPEDILKDLFHYTKGIAKADKQIVRKTLEGMLCRDWQRRFSIDEAIACFSPLVSKYQYDEKSPRSKASFFAVKKGPLPEYNTDNSCFSAARIAQVKQLIKQLHGEINSIWPYPNKHRKALKAAGLAQLLEYSTQSRDISAIINRIEYEYPAMRLGKVSARTADLLDELKSEGLGVINEV